MFFNVLQVSVQLLLKKKKQSDESTNDLKSKLLSVSTSYRADVPDLQGFIVRRRHQQVGVGRPGHVRNALQVRRESFHCFYFLCNDVNQGGRRCQTRPGDDDTSAWKAKNIISQNKHTNGNWTATKSTQRSNECNLFLQLPFWKVFYLQLREGNAEEAQSHPPTLRNEHERNTQNQVKHSALLTSLWPDTDFSNLPSYAPHILMSLSAAGMWKETEAFCYMLQANVTQSHQRDLKWVKNKKQKKSLINK